MSREDKVVLTVLGLLSALVVALCAPSPQTCIVWAVVAVARSSTPMRGGSSAGPTGGGRRGGP